VRLFVYLREAQDEEEPKRTILTEQLQLMSKRLWYGITWPSAVLTFILGNWVLVESGFHKIMLEPEGRWMLVKYLLVIGLYIYHFSLQRMYKQNMRGVFNRSSQYLRMYNELPTLFLFAVVFAVVVKQSMSALWGTLGILGLAVVLFAAINVYRKYRRQSDTT
jgi:putative membrane protein